MGLPGLTVDDMGKHAKSHQVCLHIVPIRLGTAGMLDPSWHLRDWVSSPKGQRV